MTPNDGGIEPQCGEPRFIRIEILGMSLTLDDLQAVVNAVRIPVQAVGGLTLEEAIGMPKLGAPLVVVGAPLAIDAHAFKTSAGDLKAVLSEITRRIRE